MKRYIHSVLACWMSLVATGMSGKLAPVQAQTQQVPIIEERHSHKGQDGEEHAHGKEMIAFHLPQWKTMHFDDATKSKQHADMVKRLGCEVKQSQHSGHIDLTYRSVQWRSMVVTTPQLANQWTGWLKASGFDVSHAHTDAAYASGKEVVEFRLVSWKSIHGKDTKDDKEFVDLLSKLGCEVVESEHAGHSDIKFRAPTWRVVHVKDHKAAEEIGTWLKKNGFEVSPHTH